MKPSRIAGISTRFLASRSRGSDTTSWAQFGSGVVSVDSPEAKAPIVFDDGMSVTLLAPTDRKLADLMPVYADEMKAAGLRTTDPDEVAEALAAGRVRLGAINVEDLAKARFMEDVKEVL